MDTQQNRWFDNGSCNKSFGLIHVIIFRGEPLQHFAAMIRRYHMEHGVMVHGGSLTGAVAEVVALQAATLSEVVGYEVTQDRPAGRWSPGSTQRVLALNHVPDMSR